MHPVELNHQQKCMEDKSSDHLISPACPGIHGIFGDPQVLPRVGQEYQAEIPHLATKSYCLQKSTDTEWMADVESRMDCRSNFANQNAVKGDGMDVDLHFVPQMDCNVELKSTIKDYIPMPSSLESIWSDFEQESFLLGIYIFGKNLVLVKRFMDSKEMGDVLCFYYGKFYRSDRYLRWSKYRKIRSRKCIHGQRIFTGWRQQELLSRLLPCTTEDCRNTLLEASKTFSEGKMSLERYVSSLKAAVGLKLLVEAVGIGKGKYDLTSNIEPVKTNQIAAAYSEISTSKACSSLTFGEIIKFLTGGFRLSKTQSNNLFWKAVWPRLLARGWHCEKTENYTCVASKHSLVFLIPGINNFSRGELVKGNHYFDSISDVLNKVASDPKLLEVEVEAVNNSRCKEENGWDPSAILKQINLTDCKRALNHDLEQIKLTVIDTSSIRRKKPSKVRELRTVALDDIHNSSNTIVLRETDVHVERPDSADVGMADDSIKENDMSSVAIPSNCANSLLKQGLPMDGKLPEIRYSDMLNDKNCEKSLKFEFDGKEQSTKPKLLAPVIKRRRLSACNASGHCTGELFSSGPQFKEEKAQPLSCSVEAQNIISAKLVPFEPKISMSASGKENIDKNSTCVHGDDCSRTSTARDIPSHESLQLQNLIDQSTSNFVMSKPFTTEVAGSPSDSNREGASFTSDSNEQPEDSHSMGTSDGVDAEQPPSVNSRRHSTRNRPLTRRALEAFETGFFATRKRRSTKVVH